jgi:hypothetical protein
MKKTILGILTMSVLLATSCKKASSNPGGSFTFKSVSYPVNTCAPDYQNPGTLLVDNNAATTLNQVELYFYNALPAAGGPFLIVAATPTAANQIEINMSGSFGNYIATGGNGSQTVSVSVSNGKVSVLGSGIMMNSGVDSSALSLNVTQTQ